MKRLSYIEDARCLKVKEAIREACQEMFVMPKATKLQAIFSLQNISLYSVALLAAGKSFSFKIYGFCGGVVEVSVL